MSRLSVGAQWTLRFTAALLVAISIFSLYTYARIEQRMLQDARLFLELQLKELADTIESSSINARKVRNKATRMALVGGPDLKLGVQVFDADGKEIVATGSLGRHDLGLPRRFSFEQDGRTVRELDLDDNYPYIVMTFPVRGGAVQGALYLRRFIRNARSVRDIYLWALPVALVLTLGLGSWLVRGSLRPIAEITRTARRISSTRLNEQVPRTGSGDELDELARTLNDMMSRIRQGVERMRRFSGNAAHELRTPLNALRSRLDVTLEQDRTPEEYRKILAETSREVVHLSEAVHAMMRLSQSEAGLPEENRQRVDLAGLLGDVVEFFEPLAEESGITLELGVVEAAEVSGEPAWLHQLFANLLDNAIRYTGEGGRVSVTLATDEENGTIRIAVADSGPGIDPEEQRRIFEPYHRGRAGADLSRTGAGLGLPLVREIARAHDGEVELESVLGEGATFTVALPAYGSEEVG